MWQLRVDVADLCGGKLVKTSFRWAPGSSPFSCVELFKLMMVAAR